MIEGEAHTVEINVTELKALIAAAEAAESAADGAGPAGDGSTGRPTAECATSGSAVSRTRAPAPRPAG